MIGARVETSPQRFRSVEITCAVGTRAHNGMCVRMWRYRNVMETRAHCSLRRRLALKLLARLLVCLPRSLLASCIAVKHLATARAGLHSEPLILHLPTAAADSRADLTHFPPRFARCLDGFDRKFVL